MDYRIRSVERAIDVLMIVSGGPLTLTEVTNLSQLPKGTVFRLLANLRYQGLVVKEQTTGRYVLGPGCVRLVHEVTSRFGWITTLARPALVALWERTQETITVHARLGLERVCIEELPSPHDIRYTASVGASTPLHVGSAGKVLLAYLEPLDLRRTLHDLSLVSLTDRTITDEAALTAELDLIRSRGWATSEGERISGASAISVPMFRGQSVFATLSILGPLDRLTYDVKMGYLASLQRAAASVERTVAASG
jgi:IclR family acetate operon transcriptional repressor